MLHTIKTSQPVAVVIAQIENILLKNNVTIFAKISHSQAAKEAGLQMSDEELLIFGNPSIGTDLMLENPAIGIELPLKILAWRQNDITYVAYKDPAQLITDYSIIKNAAVISSFSGMLQKLLNSIPQ